MRGNAEIEGQDVDLPFVVKPASADGERLDELLQRFGKYAAASYPNTPRSITASSVELRFVGSKVNYDLVPMLGTRPILLEFTNAEVLNPERLEQYPIRMNQIENIRH